jgi:hypothetical protein
MDAPVLLSQPLPGNATPRHAMPRLASTLPNLDCP